MTDDIQGRVLQIIADQAMLAVADISMTATLSDLGIDSMGLVESIFAIEEAFDVHVPFNANTPGEGDFDFSSVAAIVAAVRQLVADQKA
ncbi:MAG: acyl carrier protein [Paracoccaceae bacterium]